MSRNIDDPSPAVKQSRQTLQTGECIYCGKPTGDQYDEHQACVESALKDAMKSKAASERTFKVGDRVRINYGPGYVVQFTPARGDIGALVVVVPDVGPACFRRPEDVELLEADHAE